MKQVGTALIFYANTYEDYIPAAGSTSTTYWNRRLSDMIQNNEGKNDLIADVFRCPGTTFPSVPYSDEPGRGDNGKAQRGATENRG